VIDFGAFQELWRKGMLKKDFIFVLALTTVMTSTSFAGLGSDKSKYIGGTVATLKEGDEGKSSTKDEKMFLFEGGKDNQDRVQIPYEKVDSIEYGQKAGRRVGVAFVVNPIFIFSKKRRHFLTLGYTDADGKQQAAVFELGKDVVRVTLATLEARTGRKIEYQDEEARKSGRGN
jgi:hypothetical protein